MKKVYVRIVSDKCKLFRLLLCLICTFCHMIRLREALTLWVKSGPEPHIAKSYLRTEEQAQSALKPLSRLILSFLEKQANIDVPERMAQFEKI